MSTIIEIAGSLIPGTEDTPLDKRGRVATLADIENIENPFIGMPFYVTSERLLFVVRSLKRVPVGNLTATRIDDYGPAVRIPDKLTLIRPVHKKALWPVLYAYPTKALAEDSKIVLCDGSNFANVFYWNGVEQSAVTTDGIGDIYENLPVEIDVSALPFDSGYFVYHWVGEDGYVSDAISLPFPTIAEPTPFHLRALRGPGVGMSVTFISAAEYDALLEPDPKTIYFVENVGIVCNGTKYYKEA